MRLSALFSAVTTLLVFLFACFPAAGQTVTWTGAGDGTSWNQATNWSPAGVPAATADVVIPAGASAVTLNVAASVRSLTLSRALNMTGSCPSLTLTAGINLATAQGVLTTAASACESLIFNGTQSISGPGRIALKTGGARVNGAGAVLTIAPGATVTNAAGTGGTIALSAGTSLANGGTITATGGSGSVTINGPALTNSPGGVLQALSNATLTIATTTWSNQGQLTINAGTARVTASTASLGAIARTSGTLELAGPYTGATLTADTALGTVNLGTGFTATGVTFATAGTGTLAITGGPVWNSCTLASSLALGTSCNILTVSGGLTLPPGVILTTGNGVCEQLRFTGVQTISGSGEIRLGGGQPRVFGLGAALTIGPGVTLRTDTVAGSTERAFKLDTGATLFNQGTISASNGKTLYIGNLPQSPTGAFINQPGGVVSCTSQGTILLAVTSWANNGTFELNQGSLGLSGTYSTFGNVTNTGGTLRLYGNFQTGPSLTVPAGWTYELNCPLTGVTINAAPGAAYAIRGGTLTNCTLNGTANIPISGAALNNCTFNAPITTTGIFVTMAAPVFNAPATLGEMTITGGITVNGVTLTKGDGYIRFVGGTQTISGSGTLVGLPNFVGDNTTLFIPSTFTLSADTMDLSITIGRNARLDSSAAIHASGHMVGVAEGYTNGVGDFVNRGTITLVNGATLVFEFNLRWQNLGIIAPSTGSTLNLGGVYSALGTIDRSGGGTITTILAGTFNPGAAFTITPDLGTVRMTGVMSGVTFTGPAQPVSISAGTYTNCHFHVPVSFVAPTNDMFLVNCHFYAPLTATQSPITARGSFTLHDVPFTMNNSAINFTDVAGVLAGTGDMTLNASIIQSLGQVAVTVESGIHMTCTGGCSVIANLALNFLGSATVSGRSSAYEDLRLYGYPMTIGGTVSTGENAILLIGNFGTTWTNSGAIELRDHGIVKLNGTYSALGQVVRNDHQTGRLLLQGTFTPGPTFHLDDSRGVLGFACAVTGTTFTADPGLIYDVPSGIFTSCTWAAPFVVNTVSLFFPPLLKPQFSNVTVAADGTIHSPMNFDSGLTFVNGHTLTLEGYYQYVEFDGTQSILGNGRIRIGDTTNGALVNGYGTLTVGPQITITSDGMSDASPGGGILLYGPMINQGVINSRGAGRSLAIYGSSLVNNGLIAALDGSFVRQQTALTNNGLIQIAPTSHWQIDPTYTLTMTPTGRIESQVAAAGGGAGGSGGISAGRVVVSGRLTAGGTLAVTDAAGHPAVCSTSAPIASTQGTGQIDGAFAQLITPPGPPLSTGSIVFAAGAYTYHTTSPIDIGSAGALAGPDGVLDNNDFIVFINMFFSLQPGADVGSSAGITGSDGLFDNNDFIAFINLFFGGC